MGQATHLSAAEFARLGRWWRSALPSESAPVETELIAGGKSNLTFRVATEAGGCLALRRPPYGKLLPRAHDVAREFRIISALYQHSSIPVPRPIGSCSDLTVLGAPFIVTDFVQGHVLRTRREAASLPPPVRAAAADDLVARLVDLHALDPTAVGLGSLGPPTGFLPRQLNRWHDQYRRSARNPDARFEAVHRRLVGALPDDGPSVLVHGDYRLDNVIVDVQGRIVAILDWEIATLGNPVADLALLVCYWAGTGDEAVGPTALAGFPTRSEIVARYRELSGRDLGRFDWFRGFSYWKLACIAQGVLARYRDGTGGGDGTVDADRLATTVAVLLARAEEALSAGRTVEP